MHKDGSTSPHASSGKPSQLHTSKQNKSLTFFFTVPLGKRLPAVLLLWLYRTPTNLLFSATSSSAFHAPVFLPVALSLRNAILCCTSPTTTQMHVYHYANTTVGKHGGMMPYTEQTPAPRKHPKRDFARCKTERQAPHRRLQLG